jgi:precorrin-4 methylase
MDPILDKARASQGFLERLVNAIPGFKGYRERELRRDADQLQREHLAKTLHESQKPLAKAAEAASRSGNLDVINDIESARKKLDRATARVRTADRGYSGFFDPVKVNEEILGRLYQFDLESLAGVATISGAASALGSGVPTKAEVQAVVARIEAFDDRLNDREAILRAVK